MNKEEASDILKKTGYKFIKEEINICKKLCKYGADYSYVLEDKDIEAIKELIRVVEEYEKQLDLDYVDNNFIEKDKIRQYLKENKRIYEQKTPNRNRVVYKPCVLLTREVEDLLKE